MFSPSSAMPCGLVITGEPLPNRVDLVGVGAERQPAGARLMISVSVELSYDSLPARLMFWSRGWRDCCPGRRA